LYLEHHRVLELPFFHAYHARNLEMLLSHITILKRIPACLQCKVLFEAS
jgi:hypothetical protein